MTKTLKDKKNQWLWVVILSVVFLGACAKKSSDGSSGGPPPPVAANPPPVPPPCALPPCTIDPGTPDYPTNTIGATADLKITSFNDFNSYVGSHPLNNPTAIKISVELQHVGDLRYGGRVAVSYTDNGIRYEGWLESGLGKNQSFESSKDNGLYEAHYNYWFGFQGKTVFNGFFQDTYGAVVLVFDGTQNQGDAQGGVLASGSIWFKNFPQTFAPQGPLRKCWFITLGPYDCRSGTVLTKTNPYPSDGYTLLGTFTGLDLSKALTQ